MAATFAWDRDTGTQTGSPTKGTTRSAGTTDTNWKSTDTYATAYTAAPITDGTNSFEIWNFGHFSGTFNQVLTGLFAHTATAFGTGLTLKGTPACTGDGDRLLYTTPSATATPSKSTGHPQKQDLAMTSRPSPLLSKIILGEPYHLTPSSSITGAPQETRRY